MRDGRLARWYGQSLPIGWRGRGSRAALCRQFAASFARSPSRPRARTKRGAAETGSAVLEPTGGEGLLGLLRSTTAIEALTIEQSLTLPLPALFVGCAGEG
jgi:hypothetical protein